MKKSVRSGPRTLVVAGAPRSAFALSVKIFFIFLSFVTQVTRFVTPLHSEETFDDDDRKPNAKGIRRPKRRTGPTLWSQLKAAPRRWASRSASAPRRAGAPSQRVGFRPSRLWTYSHIHHPR